MGSYINDHGEREQTYLGSYSTMELAERARDAFHFLAEPEDLRQTVIHNGFELDSGWYEEFWSDWTWTLI